MTWGKPLGLDELMIINPGLPSSETYFLGNDGTVYQLQEIDDEFPELGELFLGDDGTLYQLQNYRVRRRRRIPRRRSRDSRMPVSRSAAASTCRCHRKKRY